jgi:hypothetical protein
LVQAAARRIKAAIDRSQRNFDDMEEAHGQILAGILTIILVPAKAEKSNNLLQIIQIIYSSSPDICSGKWIEP